MRSLSPLLFAGIATRLNDESFGCVREEITEKRARRDEESTLYRLKKLRDGHLSKITTCEFVPIVFTKRPKRRYVEHEERRGGEGEEASAR